MKKNYNLNKKIKNTRFIICFIFIYLLLSFSYINIVKKDYYLTMLDKVTNTTYSTKNAPRGRIYDRNNNLLVDNKLKPVVYYLKSNKVTAEKEIEIANRLASLLDVNYSKLSIKNIKDYYIATHDTDNLVSNDEWDLFNNRKIDNDDMYNIKSTNSTSDGFLACGFFFLFIGIIMSTIFFFVFLSGESIYSQSSSSNS